VIAMVEQLRKESKVCGRDFSKWIGWWEEKRWRG